MTAIEETNTPNTPDAQDIGVPPAQPKRGRGRPPKNPPSETGPEKENPSGNSQSGTTTAKPRKTKSGKVDVHALANQLVGLHQLAVVMSGNQFPELAIAPQEGEILASGICAVCEHYDLSIDGKTGAFLQLIGAAAMVYAPRIIAIRQRVQRATPIEVPANPIQ